MPRRHSSAQALKRANARRLLLGNTVIPRGSWLCYSRGPTNHEVQAGLSKFFLVHYFRSMGVRKLRGVLRDCGERAVSFEGTKLFKADNAERFGNDLWCAFGNDRPPTIVVDTDWGQWAKDQGSRRAGNQGGCEAASGGRATAGGKQRVRPARVSASRASHNEQSSEWESAPDPRIGNEPKVPQTACVVWTIGQLAALIWLLNGLEKGAVIKVERENRGICERLKLHLNSGKTCIVDSAETLNGNGRH